MEVWICGSGYAAPVRPVRPMILLLLSALAAAVELVAAPGGDRCGEVRQWTLEGAPAAWWDEDPDRTPRLMVTAPDGTRCERPFFAHDAGVLAVRAVARMPGRHRWDVVAPNGQVACAGEWLVVPGSAPPGPVGRSSLNPSFLTWADGTPYLPVGANVAWVGGDPVAGYDRILGRMRGCSHVRIWLASWGLGQHGGHGFARAAQVDRVLAIARRHGLLVTLVLDNHTDVWRGSSAPGNDPDERGRRFLAGDGDWTRRAHAAIARWGADDAVLAFELINELDLVGCEPAARSRWLRRAVALVRSWDPDHRLVTASWSGSGWTDADAAGLDELHLHGYVPAVPAAGLAALDPSARDALPSLVVMARRTERLPVPWLLGECGFQGTETWNPGNDADSGGVLLRQQMWAGFLLGGCGSGMPWWWDSHIDAFGLWPSFAAFARIAGTLDLRDGRLAALRPVMTEPLRVLGWVSPRQALLWPQRQADTWYALVTGDGVPDPLGRRVVVAGFLPGRTYRWRTWDACAGTVTADAEVKAAADGNLVLPIGPGRSDAVRWTLHLTGDGSH